MLQVARLAPTQLGESRELVVRFLHGQLNPDGGFQDRSGCSDLYYTVFGLDALVALQADLPAASDAYLKTLGDGADLDFVHLACLARAWATLRPRRDDVPGDSLLMRLEAFRTADGGYAQSGGASHGSVYAAFLALGAYEDLGRQPPDAPVILESIARLRASDGSYANHPGLASGTTPTTAAAVLLLRHLDATVDRDVGMWLLDRCQPRGGFVASASTPMPDLLSTATALHALSAMHLPIGGLQEPCLDFVDSLWTNRGGFHGSWLDDMLDCEYTYYGLLALGHLSMQRSS
jgi:prenyltransferase beta subunit